LRLSFALARRPFTLAGQRPKPTEMSIQPGLGLTVAVRESPLGLVMKYMLALRVISTPFGKASTPVSGMSAILPSTYNRSGARQRATVVLPMRVAMALLIVAFGHVGAPDTCRA